MKTKEELKINDVVWINIEPIKKDPDLYKKISKPIAVIVKELYGSSVVLEPVNEESGIGRITDYYRYHVFYETYEEALTDLITEVLEVTNNLRSLANKIETDLIDLRY